MDKTLAVDNFLQEMNFIEKEAEALLKFFKKEKIELPKPWVEEAPPKRKFSWFDSTEVL